MPRRWRWTDPIATRRKRVDAEASRLAGLGATITGALSEEGLDHYAVGMKDPEGRSVHAELVAFGVAHHISERAAILVSLDELGAEVREPGDLFGLAVRIDMDIEVDPVLRELALRNLLKEEPGLHTPRVPASRHVPER